MKILSISAMWCPGCLVMRPIWTKVLKEYPNIEVENLDFDIDKSEVLELNIGSKLPVAIILDDNNNELARIIGEKSKKEIIEVIEGVINES